MTGARGRAIGLAVTCAGIAVAAWPAPATAQAAAPKRIVLLSGGPHKASVICGAKRRAVSLPKGGRASARVPGAAGHALVLGVARCSPSRRWVSWEKVRVPVRGAGTAIRLPLLVPGGYRVRATGLRPAYLRIAGRGSGLRDPETGRLYPLLDRDRVRAPMIKFCDGPNGTGPRRPDGARLPLDPRRLVNSSLRRDDIAAYYNASWIEVHDAPGFRPHPVQFPRTCGGFREWAADGRRFIETRPFFALITGLRAYDNLWRVWGLNEKPVDFDQQVMDRYGLSRAPFRNPYPLAGEDPNATGGGSGQLPLGLIQGRNRDGSYNGKITITCSACHDSILGDSSDGIGLHYGRGSDAIDVSQLGMELAGASMIIGDTPEMDAAPAAVLPYPYGNGRGVTNSFGLLDFLPALFDMETLDTQPGVEFFPGHGAAGQVQTPNWWNRSHRTRMFLNGELSGDNSRVGMALAIADPKKTGAERKALEPDFERIHVFFDSLSPPKYPAKVDKGLAEEGAILFHTKDLWDDPRNKGIPQVGGNGSCASCHGVYSPRFAHDERYLPDPRLKGVSANITPLETIRTDKARTNLVNPQFKRAWNTSWWGYDELNPKWTKEGQGRRGTTFERMLSDYGFGADRLAGPNVWTNDPLGYEAPPLYGIWASAPYFHNASVPTVRGVLRPAERPKVWRRPSSRPGVGGIVQGFDRSLAGYDMQNLGYRFESLPCPDPCHPKASPISVVEGMISNILGDDLWVANQAHSSPDENDRQRRMTVNTTEYSRGNQGHDFTQALTDEEVRAILEYLKTL